LAKPENGEGANRASDSDLCFGFAEQGFRDGGTSGMRGEDLSGFWDGLYSYPRVLAPVSFVADLKETGEWLTGATRETAASGSATGQNLSATLQGRRSGSSVKFLKLYDGSVPGFDSVAYEGNVSADGTEIDGRWTAIGNWSGTFLMIRSQGVAESRSKTAEERLGGAR
jgi:hypothetical protein